VWNGRVGADSAARGTSSRTRPFGTLANVAAAFRIISAHMTKVSHALLARSKLCHRQTVGGPAMHAMEHHTERMACSLRPLQRLAHSWERR
jgi:hypothetical protein